MDQSPTNPTGSSPLRNVPPLRSASERIEDKIQHLLRNKLQAISSGQFLLEAGIKKNDWELVASGWKATKKNQVDLIRCSNHLMVLGRLEALEPDPIQLGDLWTASVQEFESLFGKCTIHLNAEKSSQPCLLDPFVIRSTLIGLIRVGSHSESDTLDELDIQILQSNHVVIEIKSHSKISIEAKRESNTSLSVEWMMAEKVVSKHGGTLRSNHTDDESCLILELPETKQG